MTLHLQTVGGKKLGSYLYPAEARVACPFCSQWGLLSWCPAISGSHLHLGFPISAPSLSLLSLWLEPCIVHTRKTKFHFTWINLDRYYSLRSKSTGRIGYTSFKRTKKPQKHQQPLVPDVMNFAPNANIALCAVDTKPWVWRMSWKFTFQDDIDKILIWDKNLLIMIGQVISGYIKSPWNYLLLFWENQL